MSGLSIEPDPRMVIIKCFEEVGRLYRAVYTEWEIDVEATERGRYRLADTYPRFDLSKLWMLGKLNTVGKQLTAS